MKRTTTVMGNRKEKQLQHVCLNCGEYMTTEQAREQMEHTGWDKPVCCSGSMIMEIVKRIIH